MMKFSFIRNIYIYIYIYICVCVCENISLQTVGG
jgi:hypothetical protein